MGRGTNLTPGLAEGLDREAADDTLVDARVWIVVLGASECEELHRIHGALAVATPKKKGCLRVNGKRS